MSCGARVEFEVYLQVRLTTTRRGRLVTMIGNGLNVVKVMPESAIKFGAYEVGFLPRIGERS